MSNRTVRLPILSAVTVMLAIGIFALLMTGCGKSAPKESKEASSSAPETASAVSNLPNIVLIVLDTTRADHLPFFGYSKNTAPFMASLVAQGTLFENAFAASGWTAPSTATIHTGLVPTQHGVVIGMQSVRLAQKASPESNIQLNPLPPDCVMLAELLAQHGYSTFGTAANMNIGSEIGFNRGFNEFKGYNDAPAADLNATVMSWKDKIVAARKYFLYVHYNDPHTPYMERAPWFAPPDPAVVPPTDTGKYDLALSMAKYDSEISYMDDHFRQLFETFGWDRDTLVIVTADHGEEFMDHGDTGHGFTLYREMTHVPLFIYYPAGGVHAARVTQPAGNVDIVPTIRALLGIPSDSHPDLHLMGTNLLPTLRGESPLPADRPLFAHIIRQDHLRQEPFTLRGVVHDGWHYIQHSRKGESLYHMPDDPAEQKNLIDEKRPRADDLLALIEKMESDYPPYPTESTTINLDNQQLKDLEKLGYVGR